MQNSSMSGQRETLLEAIDRVGYYPAVVAQAVRSALAGEEVRSFALHHEPTFDLDEVRRHITVLTLTPSRLLVTHTDENPPDDVLTTPYTSTSTEAIPLSRIGSVAVTRIVPNQDSKGSDAADGPSKSVAEAVLTVGWGAVQRVDLEPATCGDPDCDADHGYTGVLGSEDFSMRVSAAADGEGAVDRLLEFCHALSAATATP